MIRIVPPQRGQWSGFSCRTFRMTGHAIPGLVHIDVDGDEERMIGHVQSPTAIGDER